MNHQQNNQRKCNKGVSDTPYQHITINYTQMDHYILKGRQERSKAFHNFLKKINRAFS